MKCQIARGIRVHVTQEEYKFVQAMTGKVPFMLHNLSIQEQAIAQRLGDKAIFVRKKLAHTTQYNLNKNIVFLYE
tara:strand:+ start:207 stop:431 length:225 start_codon:yes stop_codon:yes gene_type:complete